MDTLPLVTTRIMPFAVILDPVHWHVHCGLDGACLTKDHLAMLGSIGIRNGRIVFLPCALAPIPRETRKPLPGRPPLRFGL